jgi:hypothetical protein
VNSRQLDALKKAGRLLFQYPHGHTGDAPLLSAGRPNLGEEFSPLPGAVLHSSPGTIPPRRRISPPPIGNAKRAGRWSRRFFSCFDLSIGAY